LIYKETSSFYARIEIVSNYQKDIKWYGSGAYASKKASFLTEAVCQKPERIYTAVVWTYSIKWDSERSLLIFQTFIIFASEP
jgi:hypothetical protein